MKRLGMKTSSIEDAKHGGKYWHDDNTMWMFVEDMIDDKRIVEDVKCGWTLTENSDYLFDNTMNIRFNYFNIVPTIFEADEL